MEIWQVTFSYETPGERALNVAKDVYNVVAKTEEDAAAKAYEDFSNTYCYNYLNLSIEGRVKSETKRITGSEIRLPKLTLPDDKEKYNVSAKMSEDGFSLEYIILENNQE